MRSMSMTRGPHRSAGFRPSPTSSPLTRSSSASGLRVVRASAGVDEPFLVGLSPRGGAVEAGDGGEFDLRLARERAQSPAQAQNLVADIAAEREHDARF